MRQFPPEAGEAPPRGWSPALRATHWISAATITPLAAIGLAMTRGAFDAGVLFDLYQQHKSLGFLALMLTLLRLALRAALRRPVFPVAMGTREIALAKAAHAAIYALLLALPIAGWVMVSASPLPVPTQIFGWLSVPPLVAPDPVIYEAARAAHRAMAWALILLVALHVAAAMKHHWIDRDDSLRRMLRG